MSWVGTYYIFEGHPNASLVRVKENISGSKTMYELYYDLWYVNNNETICSYSGVGTKIYTFQRPVGQYQPACEVRLMSGVIVNMEAGETVTWDGTQDTLPCLVVEAGATLNMAINSILKGDNNIWTGPPASPTQYLNSAWFLGTTNFQGTSGNEITITAFNNLIFQHYKGNEHHNWSYVDVKDFVQIRSGNWYVTPWMLEFDPFVAERPQYNFDHITVSQTDWTTDGVGLKMDGGDYSGCTFDNWVFDGVRWPLLCIGSTFKFTNTEIKNMPDNNYISGPSGTGYIHSTSNDTGQNQNALQQPKITFEDCVFDNNYTNASDPSTLLDTAFWATGDTILKFKNCTVKNNTYGFVPVSNSKFLYQGDITFINIDYGKAWQENGSHYFCYSLDLTVEDMSGNPVENAVVSVQQAINYEYWTFFTNPAGKILDCYGDLPVFIEKEETTTATYNMWSDSISEGRYHLITIIKEGFQIWQRKIEFTDNRVIVAKMQVVGGPRLITGSN